VRGVTKGAFRAVGTDQFLVLSVMCQSWPVV